MANKKGKAEAPRSTLAEVKEQQGGFLFVNYEGIDWGGMSLPAPRQRFAGDVVRELMIIPFSPQQIDEEWLDDLRFKALYEKHKGIKVWKSDTLPTEIDTNLPHELTTRLNNIQLAYAKTVALSPYTEQMKEVIQAQDRMGSEEEVIRSNNRVILPFLKAVEFYETRYMKRPEVLKDIRNRIKRILEEKSRIETMEPF